MASSGSSEVTADAARHEAELLVRKRLSASDVCVQLYDAVSDVLGNHTLVLEYGETSLRELITSEQLTAAHARAIARARCAFLENTR